MKPLVSKFTAGNAVRFNGAPDTKYRVIATMKVGNPGASIAVYCWVAEVDVANGSPVSVNQDALELWIEPEPEYEYALAHFHAKTSQCFGEQSIGLSAWEPTEAIVRDHYRAEHPLFIVRRPKGDKDPSRWKLYARNIHKCKVG